MGAIVLGAAFAPSAAWAQTAPQTGSTLIDTAIPDNFDRNRNVSVLERPRPDYDQLGIRLGGFRLLPRAENTIGWTSNVYNLGATAERSDGFVVFGPELTANSD